MPEKSEFRLRVTPPYPFVLEIEDASGKFTMAFNLCYTLNAFCLFERVTEHNFLKEMGEILGVPSVSHITVLLWAGATDPKNPDYDLLGAIRENLTLADLPKVKDAIIKALLSQLSPEAKAKLEALMKNEEPPADPIQPATAAQ